ncbi:hypothetical protein TRFO_11235 [Tritrichomonas foetus]|uniref:KATNIP domain-containing protein n=1 Tax=Tritrichomonas foetus TaxID=1144522 RepID=A0A1J4JA88_9EUKA|nr:hypothetical protein TRFO_11235 [Tritrichomonas foetus]|eukprot:OHS94365.1 hypothetical protein TRFO_11235 [Tritrichomonas foetus]
MRIGNVTQVKSQNIVFSRITKQPYLGSMTPKLAISSKLSSLSLANPIRRPAFLSSQKSQPLEPLEKIANEAYISGSKSKFSCMNQIITNRHEVIIRINSNWGNGSRISCSKIDIIGSQKKPLTINKITMFPIQDTIIDFDCLVSGSLIKDKDDPVWSMKWPPEAPLKNIDLIFDIMTSDSLETIRIWPISFNIDENIKNASIIVDKMLIFSGNLANDFGITIPLNDMMNKKKPIDYKPFPIDHFGILPFRAITSLTIHIMESYKSSERFGLQQIILFDGEGDFFDVREKAIVSAEYCGSNGKTILDIFYGPNEKRSNESKKMWQADLTKSSRIMIRFQHPILISAVSIITLRPVPGPIDVGVKKVRIVAGKNTVYTGKLAHDFPHFDDSRECTNVIFLYDNESVRENVLRIAYPEKTMYFNPENELYTSITEESIVVNKI